jgi:hypothetical protein
MVGAIAAGVAVGVVVLLLMVSFAGWRQNWKEMLA